MSSKITKEFNFSIAMDEAAAEPMVEKEWLDFVLAAELFIEAIIFRQDPRMAIYAIVSESILVSNQRCKINRFGVLAGMGWPY
jgi:hypothetical protein